MEGPLRECYLAFLREVISPLVTPHAPAGELLYQVMPNFRCHMPGTGHLLVQRHTDSDYHHQPSTGRHPHRAEACPT